LSRHKGKKARDKVTTPLAGPDSATVTPTECNADAGKVDSEPETTKSEANLADEPAPIVNSVETPVLEGLAMAQFYVSTAETPVGESETDTDAEVTLDGLEAVQEKVDIINLDEAPNARDQALKSRGYVLKELISTEKTYIQDLALIVEGYIAEIRNPNSTITMPVDLSGGKERMVFGNIEAIFEWHRE
jgi:hypothetical protein